MTWQWLREAVVWRDWQELWHWVPHHVTQRGNRRQQVFFSDADYQTYVTLLAGSCRQAGVAVWAYCLMPNHVHLILVPRDEDGLRAALARMERYFMAGQLLHVACKGKITNIQRPRSPGSRRVVGSVATKFIKSHEISLGTRILSPVRLRILRRNHE